MGKKGFTLLEVLISVVIFALLAVIVGGAMAIGYRSLGKGERRIESLERTKAMLSLLDSQIQSQVPLSFPGEDEDTELYFRGTRESMTFTSTYSLWGGQKGPSVVTYRLDQDQNGKKSFVVVESVAGGEGEREALVIGGLDDMQITYYREDAVEGESGWVEEWEEETVIPRKIKFEVTAGPRKIVRVITMRMNEPMVHEQLAPKKIQIKK